MKSISLVGLVIPALLSLGARADVKVENTGDVVRIVCGNTLDGRKVCLDQAVNTKNKYIEIRDETSRVSSFFKVSPEHSHFFHHVVSQYTAYYADDTGKSTNLDIREGYVQLTLSGTMKDPSIPAHLEEKLSGDGVAKSTTLTMVPSTAVQAAAIANPTPNSVQK